MTKEMVIKDFLTRNAKTHPHAEVIHCEPCQLTLNYEQLNNRVNSLCHGLIQEGCQKGDRIAVIASNCHIHPEILFAAAKGGWILVEIDHRLSAKEIEYIIENSDARILFIGKGYSQVISGILGRYKKLKAVFFPDDYDHMVSSHPKKEPDIEVREEDTITLIYTSGTTGQPKGVIYTHKNLVQSINNIIALLPVDETDRTLHTSPFSHVAPIWPFLLHTYFGASNVIIDNLDTIHILETIQREKITTWNTVPLVIGRLLNTAEKERFDVTSLRWITYGASPIPLPVLKEALKFFGSILNQVYGCSETYLISFLRASDHKLEGSDEELKRLTSCGLEANNTESAVVNQEGERVRPGEIGEIITRGDHVSPGYWKKEDETRTSMKNGWFYTGDLATIDESGYIYITGRRKEIIVTGGENVSPKELENVLYSHEAVREACVVGLPHVSWGEGVTGFVVLHPEKTVTEQELIAFSRQHLAKYKCPKSIIFVEDLPRTTSGKILKRKLREWYCDHYKDKKTNLRSKAP